jgi:hypothetical protein
METSERDDRGARIARIASMVERYVAAHPTASDTIAGIRRWWLIPAPSEEDASLLESALEHLVDRGVMTKRTLPDGNVAFSGKGLGGRSGRG